MRLKTRIVVATLGTILCIVVIVALQRHGAQLRSSGSLVHAWWTDRQAGLVGGLAGSVVGILGGVVGSLAGTGKAKRLTLGFVKGLIVSGVACALVGIAAVAVSQPWSVYYPLLLVGVLCTIVFGANYPVIRRAYAQRELRKMESLDA